MQDFISLLQNRRSCRKFQDRPVEPEKIEQLKKAVLMSPAGKRANEWQFFCIKDKEVLKQLSTAKDFGSTLLEGAPLAIVIAADETKADTFVEDASIAAIILQLEAEDLGLGSCWVQMRMRQDANGTDSELIVKRVANVPDNLRVQCVIAIGYKDDQRKPYDLSKLPYDHWHEED